MTLTKMLRRFTASAIVFGSLLVMAGNATADTRVFVRIGPPAPVIERRAIAPGPRYVWAPGFYRWDRRAYAWVPGQWIVPPRPRAVWVPGHWVRERRGWYFVDGRWR
jgi:WXXGXW repeat (2 copies)